MQFAPSSPPFLPPAPPLPMQLTEVVSLGMKSEAIPRALSVLHETLKMRLTESVPNALHQSISRGLIQGLVSNLTVSVFERLMQTAPALITRATSSVLLDTTLPRVLPAISLSLTHSLMRHPASDVYCAICQQWGTALSDREKATLQQQANLPPEIANQTARGPYCGLCERVKTHDRLLDANVRSSVQREAYAFTAFGHAVGKRVTKTFYKGL